MPKQNRSSGVGRQVAKGRERNERLFGAAWRGLDACCWLCLLALLAAIGALTPVGALLTAPALAEQPPAGQWTYSAEQLSPFWEGEVMHGESVLFLRDEATGEARAKVLFPIQELLSVQSSAGDVTYEPGKDFQWRAGSRELVLPPGSRIPSRTVKELRRPAKSQKYELTHRDGDGEIFFGGELQYAQMQTCITYRHAADAWTGPRPRVELRLPRTVARLVNRQPLAIVTLGDSITAGANASALYNAAPFQPAWPELVRLRLAERFRGQVQLTNLAVGGTDTAWGLTQIDKVIEARPDLVLLAFGMNDAAGRSAESYGENTRKMVERIREQLPQCEIILVASMLGNRDWVRLDPEKFPQYREQLLKLAGEGVAVADVTAIWAAFLELKRDWDQSGNGVNHPNDFGHRVYAQAICALVDPRGEPTAEPTPPRRFVSGGLQLREQRLLGNYTYSYACAAGDLDGDGDLDLTSSDAEPNSNLYLLLGDGQGRFSHSFIQKYAGRSDQPIRLERHALGDISGDGRPDVVIVDNLNWDIRWFENPGAEQISQPWKLHRVSAPQEVPGSYDVALADFDHDGDLDVAASSWRYGNRFDWFENRGAAAGERGTGQSWVRHPIEAEIGETRTIAVADFNRDGRPDLLGTSRTGNQIVWYANAGAGESWVKTVIDDQTVAPTHGHPADVDGDGDLDVVMAFGLVAPGEADSPASHQVAWYENVGPDGLGQSWKKHLIAAGFPQGFEAVAGDLDGDGDQDVVATGWSPSGRLAWFENSGDPRQQWKQHAIKDGWSNAVTVILADFDHDGRLDIAACAERGANELVWWRNEGPAP